MIEVKDQMNRIIRLEKNPQRIISLVPSQTELLYDLGLGDRVVGITKFCIHPNHWYKNKTRVGGTKNIDHKIISQLNPDLIIGNKEENSEEDVLKLIKKHQVYISDVYTLEDALRMTADIGSLTKTSDQANQLIKTIQADFVDLPILSKSILYLIWFDPYMAVGPNTFIGDLLKKSGIQNSISEPSARYVTLSKSEIEKLNPDYIFLSSEPFPFKDSHAHELKKISNAQIVFVDGEIFSWYGSRMTRIKKYLTDLFQRLKYNQPQIE